MSSLTATVVVDGVAREFKAEGDGPVTVAAFRVWLESLSMSVAIGADDVDASAAEVHDRAEELAQRAEPVKPRPSKLLGQLLGRGFDDGEEHSIAFLIGRFGDVKPSEIARALEEGVSVGVLSTRKVGQTDQWRSTRLAAGDRK